MQNTKDGVSVTLSDWRTLDRPTLVQHLPSGRVYEVWGDPTRPADHVFGLEDFLAQLVDFCRERSASWDETERLRGEAVCVALINIGMMNLREGRRLFS